MDSMYTFTPVNSPTWTLCAPLPISPSPYRVGDISIRYTTKAAGGGAKLYVLFATHSSRLQHLCRELKIPRGTSERNCRKFPTYEAAVGYVETMLAKLVLAGNYTVERYN